jgi:four helix bundle protein
MMPYEKLHAWRACHDLYVTLYAVSSRWPRDERFGLTAQLRRASLSAGSCIAEGVVKRGQLEFARYLGMATASLSEVSYQLRAARDVGIATAADFEKLEALREKASRMTWRLYQGVRGTRGLEVGG